MRKFRIYQTMYLGSVEIPDGILTDDSDDNDVVNYMEANDMRPQELEPTETMIEETVDL